VATSAGLALASSVYPAAVQAAAAVGGRVVWFAIAAAGGLCVLAATYFAELAAMFPTAGGVQVYVRQAFGERLAVTVSLLYVVLAWAAGAAEAYVFASVLERVFAATGIPVVSAVPVELWVVAVITFFFVVNLRGVETAGRTQDILTYGMFFLVFGLSVWGLLDAWAEGLPLEGGASGVVGTGTGTAAGGAGGPGLGGFLTAVAYSVYLYIGFEWVTPLAEETTDVRVLPRAMPMAVALLGAAYALWTTVMVTHVPAGELLGHPTPHLVFAEALAGPAGLLIVGLISGLATFTSFNAGMMGNSRLVYGMAREGVLPRALSKVHLRYFTPWAALAFMFAVELVLALVLALTGGFAVAILMAAAIECLMYALAASVVLRLRRTRPDLERPYRAPGGRAVAGAVALVFAFLAVAVFLPPSPWVVGLLFAVAVGLAGAYSRWVVPRLRARRLGLGGLGGAAPQG